MGESAHGDNVHSCFGNCAQGLGGDAAACFEERSAVGDRNRLAHFLTAHVVEHDHVHTGFQRLSQLVKAAHLQLDLGHVTELLSELGDRRGNAAAGVHVVVLEHCRVRKVVAVVFAAADRDRVFLQRTQTRERLARVRDRGVGALDRLYRLSGGGGDAAHMLQQVERRALALEQGARLAADLGDDVALFQNVAVMLVDLRLKALLLQDRKHAQRHVDTAEHAVRLCEKARGVLLILVNEVIGGGVEVVDILQQRGFDDVVHINAVDHACPSLTSSRMMLATTAMLFASTKSELI